MPFEWIVALRYLREGRNQTMLILAGIGVGVGVIVFLSALISGLQTSLIANTLGSQPHIVVRPPDDVARRMREDDPADGVIAARVEKASQRPRPILLWQHVMTTIESVPGVTATSPVAAGAAFATRGDASKAVAVRGIDPERFVRIIDVPAKMKSGQFRVGGTDVVIGYELADSLGVGVGDKLRLASSEGRSDVFTVAGTFDLGARDVNQRWALVSLRNAQTLLDLEGGITTIELRVDRIFEADRLAAEVAGRTWLVAESWMQTNRSLLIGLRSQDSSSYMIQFFVTLAVALGIASVLVVSVVQKSREIGILKAFGTSTRLASRIFLVQGGVLGFAGSMIGCAIGTLLALAFASLAKNPDGSPTFPVDLNLQRYLLATLVATLTGIVAAVFPARRAARMDPAEVIRYG